MRAWSLGLGLVVLVALGCAPSDSNDGGTGGTAGVGGSAGVGAGGFGGAGGTSGACVTFETQRCMCDALPGRSVCSVGVWSPCDCLGAAGTGGGGVGGGSNAGDPLANKNANVNWEWTATMPMGSCRPGRYRGTFDGFYSSPIIFGFPVPIVGASADPMNPGGLEFTLEEGGAGEILTITGGKMTGTVYGFIPFECDITGSLNCGTNRFEGRLENGWYEVGGQRFNFSGPITADYDPVAASMVNGFWQVKEPNQQPPEPLGGEGRWNANYAP